MQKLLGPPTREAGFTAGLVHSVGLMALAASSPELLERALATSHTEGRSLVEVQREALGASYAEVGACLLGMWGVPLAVVEAIAIHAELPAAGHPSPEVGAALHLVVAMGPGSALPGVQTERLEALVGSERTARWIEVVSVEAESRAR